MGLCIFSSLCLSTYRHKSDAINIPVYNFVKIYMYFSLVCVWDLLGYRICMEKEMATHSSTFAWRILWTEEPGGLLSMGSQRVGHDWSDLACMHALEMEMATHSSIFAWRIPGTEEPGRLPSMGSHRVGHDWSNLAAAAAAGYVYVQL